MIHSPGCAFHEKQMFDIEYRCMMQWLLTVRSRDYVEISAQYTEGQELILDQTQTFLLVDDPEV